MRLIGFTANYIAPIQAGTKTLTLRKASGPRPVVGEIVGFRCRYDLPPFGYGRVLAVDPIDRATFSAWGADGFDSRAAWVEKIKALYGDAPLIGIRWELLDAAPTQPESLF
jgi:hypothetical protein